MNNSKQNKPEPQECNKCKASLLRGRVVVNGEAFCKTCAPEPPEPWEESFDENYPTGLYVRHETCDCCGLEPTPPEEVTEDVKAFIRKVEREAYERGLDDGKRKASETILGFSVEYFATLKGCQKAAEYYKENLKPNSKSSD